VFNTTVGQEKKVEVEQPVSLRSSFSSEQAKEDRVKKLEMLVEIVRGIVVLMKCLVVVFY